MHPHVIHMDEFVNIVTDYTSLEPKNVVEIGAYDGRDAVELMDAFGIKPENVHMFEAHPELYAKLAAQPGALHMNVVHAAVTGWGGTTHFNAMDLSVHQNNMTSSLLARDGRVSKRVMVPAICMKGYMVRNGLARIDLLKLDVEGATLDVLKGFQDEIKNVMAMHIEVEWKEVWKGQKTQDEVSAFLINAGFVLAGIKVLWPQSDAVWVREEIYTGK
jgi:FkbM family methyltransferase